MISKLFHDIINNFLEFWVVWNGGYLSTDLNLGQNSKQKFQFFLNFTFLIFWARFTSIPGSPISHYCKCPPSVHNLSNFESDLLMMIHNVEFHPVKEIFLLKLKEDVKTMKNTKEWLINANKLSNIYKLKTTHEINPLWKISPKHIKNQTGTKSTLKQRRLLQSLKLMTGPNNNASIMC